MKKLVMVMLLVIAGCQEEQERFQHDGEYAITWTVKSTTCAAGVTLPDLVYVGQYPDNYPENKGGLSAASFYYSTFGLGKMTALDTADFGADYLDLPPFSMASLSDSEDLAAFTLHFNGDLVDGEVEASRVGVDCTTSYTIHGAVHHL